LGCSTTTFGISFLTSCFNDTGSIFSGSLLAYLTSYLGASTGFGGSFTNGFVSCAIVFFGILGADATFFSSVFFTAAAAGVGETTTLVYLSLL
jgi:hypothetical protein